MALQLYTGTQVCVFQLMLRERTAGRSRSTCGWLLP